MKEYYRIMLGRQSKYADECLDGNFIGADFIADIDFTGRFPENWRDFNKEFIPVWMEKHPEKTKIAAGLACGMLWTISKGIKIGDVMLCPNGQGSYLVGEITGDYEYHQGENLPHRRQIRWYSETIERTDMSEALQRSTGSVGTSCYITKYAEELESLIKNEHLPKVIATDDTIEDPSVFALEKHLEDFLVKNWNQTELGKNLPEGFEPKGNIFVFIDECHRTQSGKLHKALNEILRNSIIIGFTGTPLMSADKQKSIEVFGGYIHTYKYDEAVRDNVVLDLRYEARKIDQNISSQQKIDQWFDVKTRGLTDHARGELKAKWGTMQNLLSSKERLEKIAADILFDMETRSRLSDGRGNAMLVAGSIYEACRFWEIFQSKGFKKCAVVTSYNPTIDNIKGEETGGDFPTDNIKKYDVYKQMLDGKSVEDFEKHAKNLFKKQPAKMRLLIVVDKLLTGFDAPPATYLYIDKSMRNHALFQAICRVNRLDGVDKEYGYIIDYKDLFKNLENAIDDYTSEAFEEYDKEDIEGLLSNRLDKAKERIEETLELVKALCEPVKDKTIEEYLTFFCGDTNDKMELKKNEPKRLDLYKYVSSLIRAYANIAPEIADVTVGFSEDKVQEIKEDVKHYTQVRDTIKLSSGDYIDLKAYEPDMRHLIDSYVSAEESEVISNFNDMSLVELIVENGKDAVDTLPKDIKGSQEAVAETIENNLRKLLVKKDSLDPAFYAKMSKILDELINSRKKQQLEYELYLDKIVELTKEANKGNIENVPNSIKDSAAKTALYDNLGENEELAIEMHNAIQTTKKADFRGHPMKMKEIRIEVKKVLEKFGKYSKETENEVYKIVDAQPEY